MRVNAVGHVVVESREHGPLGLIVHDRDQRIHQRGVGPGPRIEHRVLAGLGPEHVVVQVRLGIGLADDALDLQAEHQLGRVFRVVVRRLALRNRPAAAGVAHTVAVRIALPRVRDVRAVVTRIAHAVAVRVLLVRLRRVRGQVWAEIFPVLDPVVVPVLSGRPAGAADAHEPPRAIRGTPAFGSAVAAGADRHQGKKYHACQYYLGPGPGLGP